MGIFKDAKVKTLVDEADKAKANGHTVFTPKLNTPMTQHGISAPPSSIRRRWSAA